MEVVLGRIQPSVKALRVRDPFGQVKLQQVENCHHHHPTIATPQDLYAPLQKPLSHINTKIKWNYYIPWFSQFVKGHLSQIFLRTETSI